MADSELVVERKKDLQKKVGWLPIFLIEKFQNWGETQKMSVLSVKPRSVEDVKKVVKAVSVYNSEGRNQRVSIRCVGDGHSWSPLFPDDGSILMYTSELVPSSGKRISLKEGDDSLAVTIAPGVTTGELSEFFKRTNVCFKTDVILDKVTYGGVIAPGCHGVGKDQLAVSDYVLGMSIVEADGEEKRYDFSSETEDKANALKCNMGLFGVMTDITFKVEPMVIVKTENDFSLTVGDLFYNPDRLKKLHDDNWSVEIFWFPFNSLSWFELMCLGLSYAFKDNESLIIQAIRHFLFTWDPWKDKLWIRKINIVEMPEEPCPNEVDYAIQDAKGLLSTGFGRIVSKHLTEHEILVPSFLKAGFEMVQRFNSSSTFEPINKAIHYQSFIEIMPVVDMEFAFNATPGTFPEQAKAMQAVIETTEEYYKNLQFPLSVAMEMRWMAYSNCLICPARAVQKNEPSETRQTLYLEVLGIAGIPGWETFTQEIATKWMEKKPKGKAPVPHWAKQWSYLEGIDSYIKEAYGEDLTKFQTQVPTEARQLFSNKTLDSVIFQVPVEKKKEKKRKLPSNFSPTHTVLLKPPNSQMTSEMWKVVYELKKHEESWQTFFMTLGEQVWNVPWKVPKMDIQKEWEFARGLLDELNEKFVIDKNTSVDQTLYKKFFM